MQNLRKLKDLAATPAFLAEMEEEFFAAMNKGYASDPKKVEFDELPGFRMVPPYIHGSWIIMDPYAKTRLGPRSGGTTVISYEEIPVWMMQYLGQYDEAAIPCLKAALRAAYAEKEFFGGRGPERFEYDGYIYRNEIDRRYRTGFQTSNYFEGYETIKTARGVPEKCFGWHSYQGMMMI